VNPFDSPASQDQPGPHAAPFSSEATPSDAPADQMNGEGTDDTGGPVENLQASLGAMNVGTSQPDQRADIDGALGELPSLLARSASGVEFL
jgi:hypothetical protein